MLENDRHEMVLVSKTPDGIEEWLCPTCGRHFLMQWPPQYKRTILEYGDVNAPHFGGKGEICLSQSAAYSENQQDIDVETYALTPKDEENLLPWRQWMDSIGFENLWNAN